MKRPAPPQWVRWYYLLVAFDVLTVSMSLYLNREIMHIYVRSVEVNQAWVERLHQTSDLSQLAADVNAPGNDVFQSHQVAAEYARMHAALTSFNKRLEAFQAELQANVEAEQSVPLVAGLRFAQQDMLAMSADADQLFDHLRSNRTVEAGKSMAEMDRHYARANQALERLRKDIGKIQEQHFDKQTEAAVSLQRFQYMIAALILLMIGGAAVYGHKLRVITERNQAALMRRQLLQRVIAAQEDERRRIARDLHDEIGQALTSLLLGLRAVAEAPRLEAAQERAVELRLLAVSTLEEVRRLACGLRPSVLDDLGLMAAVERQAADFAQTHGIDVQVHAPASALARLPGEVETALYRIVQEALSNTAKYADATRVQIRVEQQPGFVQVIVKDDGCGFDSQKIDTDGRLGLSGMRERAALLNGTLTIASQPEQGTSIAVCIPLEQEEHHGQDSRIACR